MNKMPLRFDIYLVSQIIYMRKIIEDNVDKLFSELLILTGTEKSCEIMFVKNEV